MRMERYAFGRPIGSFQAIKHKLADVYVAVELARSNAYYGAWAIATGAAELPVAGAAARVAATEAFQLASKENIQTHGGIGFTWEVDCHLYYRRVQAAGGDDRQRALLERSADRRARAAQRAVARRPGGTSWISTTRRKKPRSAPKRGASSTPMRRRKSATETAHRGRYIPDADMAESLARAKAWQAKKADAGFAAITWPKQWGGRGGSPIEQVIYNQEEANYAVPRGVFEIGLGMCMPTMMAFGGAGAARSVTCARRCAARRSGASCSPSRQAAPTRGAAHARRARRRRLDHQRPEDLDLRRALSPTSASSSPAPIRMCPSIRASPCSSST